MVNQYQAIYFEGIFYQEAIQKLQIFYANHKNKMDFNIGGNRPGDSGGFGTLGFKNDNIIPRQNKENHPQNDQKQNKPIEEANSNDPTKKSTFTNQEKQNVKDQRSQNLKDKQNVQSTSRQPQKQSQGQVFQKQGFQKQNQGKNYENTENLRQNQNQDRNFNKKEDQKNFNNFTDKSNAQKAEKRDQQQYENKLSNPQKSLKQETRLYSFGESNQTKNGNEKQVSKKDNASGKNQLQQHKQKSEIIRRNDRNFGAESIQKQNKDSGKKPKEEDENYDRPRKQASNHQSTQKERKQNVEKVQESNKNQSLSTSNLPAGKTQVKQAQAVGNVNQNYAKYENEQKSYKYGQNEKIVGSEAKSPRKDQKRDQNLDTVKEGTKKQQNLNRQPIKKHQDSGDQHNFQQSQQKVHHLHEQKHTQADKKSKTKSHNIFAWCKSDTHVDTLPSVYSLSDSQLTDGSMQGWDNHYDLRIPKIKFDKNCKKCSGTGAAKRRFRNTTIPCRKCYAQAGYCKKCYGTGIVYTDNKPCHRCKVGKKETSNKISSSSSESGQEKHKL